FTAKIRSIFAFRDSRHFDDIALVQKLGERLFLISSAEMAGERRRSQHPEGLCKPIRGSNRRVADVPEHESVTYEDVFLDVVTHPPSLALVGKRIPVVDLHDFKPRF